MMNVRREDLPKLHNPVAVQAESDRVQRASNLLGELQHAASDKVDGKARWYVLTVRNRAELSVESALSRKNIRAWVPMKSAGEKRRRGRLQSGKTEPIFRGYVFVKLVLSQAAVAGLLAESDITGMLGDGETALPVDDDLSNALMHLIEIGVMSGEPVRKAKEAIEEKYPIDGTVEITSGPMAFVRAVITGYSGTRHVRCIANLFGRHQPITVPLAKLRQIS